MLRRVFPRAITGAVFIGAIVTAGCVSSGSGGGDDEDQNSFPIDVGNTDPDTSLSFPGDNLQGFSSCATSDVGESTLAEIAPLLTSFLSARRAEGVGSSTQLREATVTIPVVFHVISKGSSAEEGEIADSQLIAQVDVLNTRFSGADGSLATPYRFQLSSINRVRNADWFTIAPGSPEETAAKEALHVGGPETLNIYTANIDGGVLGFATFPYFYGLLPNQDGIVINFRTLPGGPTQRYSTGNVVVHEAGHWLGLLHTFQGECASNYGDLVGDTPAEKPPEAGQYCPVGRDSCPDQEGIDPIHNHMTYTVDSCRTGFTQGQLDVTTFASIFFRGFDI